MTSDLLIAEDPFSTSLDRAVLAAGLTGSDFNDAYASAGWNDLTPAERANMLEYARACEDNVQWDAMILRHSMRGWRLTFDIGCMAWTKVPWTDADKAHERRQFQGVR